MSRQPWYKDGLQFQCQGSGGCCASRGEYGFVYLTANDARNMSRELRMTVTEFKKKYCGKTDGALHLVDNPGSPDCIFLTDNRCDVYLGRPTQCRTWPFWPENMKAKSWQKEVVAFCPGVGKGSVKTFNEIQAQMKEQKQADDEIWSNAIHGD